MSMPLLLLPILIKIYNASSGDKIEKNEMGGACSAHVGEERRVQGFNNNNNNIY
jgi:hypothetical protein